MPTWRIPPPIRLRRTRASAIASAGPTISEPIGRAEALGEADRQHVGDRAVVRERDAGRDVGVPEPGAVEVDAGPRRSSAQARSARRSSSGSTAPPAKLWVFSTETAAVRTKNGPMSGANSRRIGGRSTLPRGCGPGAHGEPGERRRGRRARRGRCGPRTRRAPPARARRAARTASTLAIDPVGVNSAASWPNSPATRSSSAPDGRVLAVDVVADLGARHRRAHRVGRAGEGVGAEVDHPSAHAQAVAQHLGDQEGQLEGLHPVEARVADRLVAVGRGPTSAISSPPPTHSVTSSPVSSTWTPPGQVPSARCTSKKPWTSSITSSKRRVL